MSDQNQDVRKDVDVNVKSAESDIYLRDKIEREHYEKSKQQQQEQK